MVTTVFHLPYIRLYTITPAGHSSQDNVCVCNTVLFTPSLYPNPLLISDPFSLSCCPLVRLFVSLSLKVKTPTYKKEKKLQMAHPFFFSSLAKQSRKYNLR